MYGYDDLTEWPRICAENAHIASSKEMELISIQIINIRRYLICIWQQLVVARVAAAAFQAERME